MQDNTASLLHDPPPPYELFETVPPSNHEARSPPIKDLHSATSSINSFHTALGPTNEGWRKDSTFQCANIWIRNVGFKGPVQHGYSQRCPGIEDSVKPQIFFTCEMKPRRSSITRWQIESCSESVAAWTGLHKATESDYCECVFRTLKDPSKSCVRNARIMLRPFKWFSARLVRKRMERHDRLCSCKCFSFREEEAVEVVDEVNSELRSEVKSELRGEVVDEMEELLRNPWLDDAPNI